MDFLAKRFKNIAICWVVFSLIYLLIASDWCDIELASCSLMSPNEMGDFLAGFFSPLAFVGLMITIYNQKNDSDNLLEIERERNRANNPFFVWKFKSVEKQEDYYHESDELVSNYCFRFDLFNIRGTATSTKIFMTNPNGSSIQICSEKYLIEKGDKNEVQFLFGCEQCKNESVKMEVKVESINEMGQIVSYVYDLFILDYRDEYTSEDGFDAKITLKN
ncbi:hypothetical protein [Acinetobacter beijerinckii]|uniref:hypothetical protein n=1 Tax=Acinetobacter beijerinckii TaxID=262668 RepID=UPI00300B3018